VSTCQHHDRKLQHINKKGRPVSQCPHCRGLRKSRAAHVKCDCGDKSHTQSECTHGEKGNSNSELYEDIRHAHQSDHGAVELHPCCCTHGGRCSCALKKEHLDTVPEVDGPEPASAVPPELRKPRLSATQSEGALTVFTNGHHKPTHKHIDAARAAPYTIPRSHTVHGHGIARRSVDSLPLTKRALLGHEPHPQQDSVTSAPQQSRQVKSEHGSPDLRPTSNLEHISSTIPSLESSYSPFDTGSPALFPSAFNDRLQENYFAAHEFEAPIHSAGLHAPVDWSAYGLSYDNGDYSAAPSQPPSYASFDYNNFGHPGLTNSSSGDLSEAGDYVPVPNPNTLDQESLDEVSQVESYRLSSASSYMGVPQANGLPSGNVEYLDIDEFLKNAEAQTSALQQMSQNQNFESEQYPAEHSLTVQEAQNYAHMSDSDPESEQLSKFVTTSTGVDSAWTNPLIDSEDPAMTTSAEEQMQTPGWVS